jgi:redox-sensitive bicupin YhaK (pirin superfamily)
MDSIAKLLDPELKDLGDIEVRRVLPHDALQTVGPFIFFDHFGPTTFSSGRGLDVRPHPHIGLATITYLFEGVILHRDSLNNVQEIRPGAVNWMTAGRGITHSERSPISTRNQDTRLHGIQTWVALPSEAEETEPWFHHYEDIELPEWNRDGVNCKLIAGEAYGYRSPVQTFSPLIYLDVSLSPKSQFSLPTNCPELGIYSIEGKININGVSVEPHRLAVFSKQNSVKVSAQAQTRCIIVGGQPLGTRYKWWNFVSSRRERIEQAKIEWREGQFLKVPKETEFIPLPEDIL